nr:ribonuclease P/MRP protein subunit POP5 [Leptinotarsa decemlineata]
MVRHKNRYLVLEINEIGKTDTPLKIKEVSLFESIQNEVKKLHGDFGVAAIRTGFLSKYINEHSRTAVIRCRHGPHKFVSSSIPFVKQIFNKNVVISILYIGASIKQCFSFLKNYQQKKFDEYCVTLKTEEERNELKDAMLNLDSALSKL